MDLKILKDIPPWEWPNEADTELEGILHDKGADSSDRLLAAELAGELTVIRDGLIDELLSILHDGNESEQIRATAATSLGCALEYADEDLYDDDFDDEMISYESVTKIRESLRRLYRDAAVPKLVRRRILEASVHVPQDWHRDAIRASYLSADEDWRLTAVFCMQLVPGFETQILEALDSKNPYIHYHAVCAAGNCGLDEAWPHISAILTASQPDKDLLIAAIEAAPNIRPEEAAEILLELTGSEDEDIVEAAYEAMSMADMDWDEGYDDEEDDEIFH
ncbi:conserved hypothetical protein [uncultured Desulfobacterium sp.]|uniref:HEAT repeat domain-containing protein n=1 Tax=uncultured Desulfobacterium sp. TaxID=201089 RepID=A0A445N1R7_9BACT|nr:conserved hypothetical protein [uncultured Desulfobacterium sp.]